MLRNRAGADDITTGTGLCESATHMVEVRVAGDSRPPRGCAVGADRVRSMLTRAQSG